MLGLNKKSASIILGVMLVLGVASLTHAADDPTWFSFTPAREWSDEFYADVDGFDGCTKSDGKGQNGWDIDKIGLYYDSGTDTLYVGISMWNYVIAGDIDNNGDPDGKADCFTWIDDAGLGGPAGFGEAIDFIIDKEVSGQVGVGVFDYIAGVSNSTDITGFQVVNYDTSNPLLCPNTPISSPGSCYGATAWAPGGRVTNVPQPQTSSGGPDFEFTINEFSDLLGKQPTLQPLNFGFVVRAGKMMDGTGEDYYIIGGQPTVVTLSSLTARSSAGGSASGLWLGLTGLTVLVAAGSLFWAKRRAG